MGLAFLSWVRTGLGGELNKNETNNNILGGNEFPLNTSLPINIQLNTGKSKSITAYIHGPGDITGFDIEQIIRKEPCENAIEVSPNYIPSIDFDSPELPWLLSTTGPQRGGTENGLNKRGLYPWLCLITIEEPDRFTISPPGFKKPLSSVVLPVNELPLLEWSWLWAHTQVVINSADESIEDIIKNKPDRNLSRLISPIRLKPEKLYQAFVVPVFEAGRIAGLGMELENSNKTNFAWDSSKTEVELPIYTSWRFSTGKHGDFQYLAELLEPSHQSNNGICKLSIFDEAENMNAAASGSSKDKWTINLEGAVVDANLTTGTWSLSTTDKKRFTDKLADRLEKKPGVLPLPAYGSVNTEFSGNLNQTGVPAWLKELNLDPRYRIAASLGTQVIKENQEELMASAWEQAAQIKEVNQSLRQGQLALKTSHNIYKKRIGENGSNAALSNSSLISLTASAHTAMLYKSKPESTIAKGLKELYTNMTLEGVMSLQYRKLARPSGKISKRIKNKKLIKKVNPLEYTSEKLAKGNFALIFEKKPILGSINIEELSGNAISMVSFVPQIENTVAKQLNIENNKGKQLKNEFVSDVIIGFKSGRIIKGTCVAIDAKHHLNFSASFNMNENMYGYLSGTNWIQFFEHAYAGSKNILYDSRAVTYKKINGEYITINALFRLSVTSDSYKEYYILNGYYTWNKGYICETVPMSHYYPSNSKDWYDIEYMSYIFAQENYYSNNSSIYDMSRPCVSVMYVKNEYNIIFVAKSRNCKKIGITIGLNVDNKGKVRNGWKHIPIGYDCDKDISMDAYNNHIYILTGKKLLIVTLDENCNVVKKRESSQWIIPEGYVSGVITACDFRKSTNPDLLFVYSIKDGEASKCFYRLAYNVDDEGNVLEWGKPVPVLTEGKENTGTPLSVILGISDKDSAEKLQQFTKQFLDQVEETQNRLNNIFMYNKKTSIGALDIDNIAEEIRKEINPQKAIVQKIGETLELPDSISSNVNERLQPIAVVPRFTQPVNELLRSMNPENFLIGAKSIPDNSVTVLKPNKKFIEAFLIGMNNEMSNEFLWRNYPADFSATYFNRFWDNRSEDGNILPDIAPINKWKKTKKLGDNLINDNIGLFLTIRGELLRRLPNVMLYALPAKESGGKRTIDTEKKKEFPIFSSKIDPDIYFFAFTKTPEEVYGNSQYDGWYFIFQEHPTAPRFGANESNQDNEPVNIDQLTKWEDLEWSMIDTKNNYIDFGEDSSLSGKQLPDTLGKSSTHRWAFSSAHLAHILLQRPVQVAIHATKLMEKP
ncbi:hypothetical protein EHE19_009625 [Ruminiclostridium herbifermentans]|uniref:Uncharacterized protein n=1 Tax=Ruminiclostridium herbifermentans TaxID=2488810 RepID=A0A4U7JKM1_9FIRM|nr:hypothetical protein [Ruminiclostridium herbifermentans]QNU68627.1 hypothetical protein EHE19_009625 [Ruminiclostridium herbifermentans]